VKPSVFFIFAVFFLSCIHNARTNPNTSQEAIREHPEVIFHKKLQARADTLKAFCAHGKYNVNVAILVDMSIHSGKRRIFVWDFARDTILWSGLCCHGYGKGSTEEKIVFSNEPGSYCSSLGKYKIGIRSYSKWGIHVHYKLHGLEATNSNAYKRQVVLHSHSYVDDSEIYPSHLLLGYSQGCPVISDHLMTKIDSLLKKADQPLILWIYQ
jgi:hypothetical protein